MKTCVSMECPFQLVCRDYNFGVDRSGGCKTQDFILRKSKQLIEKREKKSKKTK